MGSEAGQSLDDILHRKNLERESGQGTFAWGIGNSVGPALEHARRCTDRGSVEALFTPMKTAPKAVDVSPAGIVMWLSYRSAGGGATPLPTHMFVTSRAHAASGVEKRGHYALICHSEAPLASDYQGEALHSAAARNLVSSNPVGASQVTSVVRYESGESVRDGSYPILFRATLTGESFVRLVDPVRIEGRLSKLYEALCKSRDAEEWQRGIAALKTAAMETLPEQTTLFGPVATVGSFRSCMH
jgi:hypothetical protein